MAEAGGVLHRARYPEGEVEPGVDHHSGRADLTVVAHPPCIGHHPRRAHRRTDRLADRGQLRETSGRVLGAHQPRPTADQARRIGQVDGGRVEREEPERGDVASG